MSTDQPLGPGYPAISDGYNQMWDLGAGAANNRTTLSANTGQWPNIIKCNVIGTNIVPSGDPVPIRFYYQYGGFLSNAVYQIYFDADSNPNDTNEILSLTGSLTNTGVSSVLIANAALDTSAVAPGVYKVLTKINAGGLTRMLYAPELVEILPAQTAPTLDIASLNPMEVLVGVNAISGQRVAIQISSDLQNWFPLTTNLMTSSRWVYTNTPPANAVFLFYRAALTP